MGIKKTVAFTIDGFKPLAPLIDPTISYNLVAVWNGTFYSSKWFRSDQESQIILKFICEIDLPIESYTFLTVKQIARTSIEVLIVGEYQLNLQRVIIPCKNPFSQTTQIGDFVAGFILGLEEFNTKSSDNNQGQYYVKIWDNAYEFDKWEKSLTPLLKDYLVKEIKLEKEMPLDRNNEKDENAEGLVDKPDTQNANTDNKYKSIEIKDEISQNLINEKLIPANQKADTKNMTQEDNKDIADILASEKDQPKEKEIYYLKDSDNKNTEIGLQAQEGGVGSQPALDNPVKKVFETELKMLEQADKKQISDGLDVNSLQPIKHTKAHPVPIPAPSLPPSMTNTKLTKEKGTDTKSQQQAQQTQTISNTTQTEKKPIEKRPGRQFSVNKFKLGYGLKLLDQIKTLRLGNRSINRIKTWQFYSEGLQSDKFFQFGTDSIRTIHYYDFQYQLFYKREFIKHNLPLYCSSATCALPTGEIIQSGGVNHDNYIVSQCTLLYNYAKNWTYVLRDMPKPRCHHQIVYCKGYIFVFGGKLINDTRPPTNTCCKLDLGSNTWVSQPEMKQARFNFASCLFKDKIYAIGGQIKDAANCNHIEEFDIKGKSWNKTAVNLTERSSAGHAFPWDDNCICYIGLGSRKKTTIVYQINLTENTISHMYTIEEERINAKFCQMGHEIYMLGGGYFPHMLKINLKEMTSEKISLHINEGARITPNTNTKQKNDNLFHTYDLKSFTAVRCKFSYNRFIDSKSVAKVMLRCNLDSFRINSTLIANNDIIKESKDLDDKIYRYRGGGAQSSTNGSNSKGRYSGNEVPEYELNGLGKQVIVLDNGYVLFAGGLKKVEDAEPEEDLKYMTKSSWIIWGKIYFDVSGINIPRCLGGVGKFERKAFIFGGLTQRGGNVIKGNMWVGEYLKATETVEVFDFVGNNWKKLPAMPRARFGMQTTFFNEKFYLFGGFDQDGNFEEEVWTFDQRGYIWTTEIQRIKLNINQHHRTILLNSGNFVWLFVMKPDVMERLVNLTKIVTADDSNYNMACYNLLENSVTYKNSPEIRRRVNLIQCIEYQDKCGLIFMDKMDTNENKAEKQISGEFDNMVHTEVFKQHKLQEKAVQGIKIEDLTEEQLEAIKISEQAEYQYKVDQLHTEELFDIKEVFVTEEQQLSYNWETEDNYPEIDDTEETRKDSIFAYTEENCGKTIMMFKDIKIKLVYENRYNNTANIIGDDKESSKKLWIHNYKNSKKSVDKFQQDLAINSNLMFLVLPISYDCQLAADELRFSDNERNPRESCESFVFYEGRNQQTQIAKLSFNNKCFNPLVKQQKNQEQNGNNQNDSPTLIKRQKNINFAKYGCCGPLPDGRVLLTGGMILKKNILKTTNKCWAYNTVKDYFTPVQSMLDPRAYHAIIRRRNSFWVAGGSDNYLGTVLSSCEAYNVLSSQWEQKSNLNEPRTRHTGVEVFDTILVLGGVDKSKNFMDTVERYNESTKKWEVIGKQHEKIADLGAVVVNHRCVCYLGGRLQNGEYNMLVNFMFFGENYSEFSIKSFKGHIMNYSHIRPALLFNNNHIQVLGGNVYCASESVKLNYSYDVISIKIIGSFENLVGDVESMYACARENNLSLTADSIYENKQFNKLYIFGIENHKKVWRYFFVN